MKKNWIVETIGKGIYVVVSNYIGSNLVSNSMYYSEEFSEKKTCTSCAIGRWKPKNN